MPLVRRHCTAFKAADLDEIQQRTVNRLTSETSLVGDHVLGEVDPAAFAGEKGRNRPGDGVVGGRKPGLSPRRPLGDDMVIDRFSGELDISSQVAADKGVAGVAWSDVVGKIGLVGRQPGVQLEGIVADIRIVHKILLSNGSPSQESFML